jgi:hypothetical protein
MHFNRLIDLGFVFNTVRDLFAERDNSALYLPVKLVLTASRQHGYLVCSPKTWLIWDMFSIYLHRVREQHHIGSIAPPFGHLSQVLLLCRPGHAATVNTYGRAFL